jgi:4-amino-4-deoxy-L-arabinose transferase-like glycosyltransferase
MWGVPEVIVDTARYFIQAKYLELYGIGYFLAEWGGEISVWTDLPLVPFLQGLVLSLFGEARIAVQAFTALLFAATGVVTWLIGRTLWDDIVGGSAAALLLAMPYLLTQTALMLVDVPTMFFLTLAVFVTIKAIGEGEVRFLVAAPVAITVAMLSKYSTWLMLSVLAVVVLAHLEQDWRTVMKRGVVIGLATIFLAGLLALIKFDVVASQMQLLWGYQWPGLARWEESHVSTFLYQVHPFVTVAALCSLAIAIARRDRRYAIVAWMLLLVVVLGIKRARYVLITLPMLALMAGYALREISDGRLRRFIVACAVASGLVTAYFGYLPLLNSTSSANLMAAAERIDALESDRVEVFALAQERSIINPAVLVPILDLYTVKQIIYRQDPLAPPPRSVLATSPLRFSWEFDRPSYYGSDAPNAGDSAVVIASHPGQVPPDPIKLDIGDMKFVDAFETSDSIFKFKALVYLYEPRE